MESTCRATIGARPVQILFVRRPESCRNWAETPNVTTFMQKKRGENMRFEFSGPHLSEDSVTEDRNPPLMRRILNFITGSQRNMQQTAELRRAIAERDDMVIVAHRRERELLLLLDAATKRREQELESEVEVRPRNEQQRIASELASRLKSAYGVYMISRSKNKLRILMATLRSNRKLPDVPLYSPVIPTH